MPACWRRAAGGRIQLHRAGADDADLPVGTIGRAKEDLEKETAALSQAMHARIGGAAYVSINKALVTQASAAIPVVPLYISALYRVMKDAARTRDRGADRAAVSRSPGSGAHAQDGRRGSDSHRRSRDGSGRAARVSEMWKT